MVIILFHFKNKEIKDLFQWSRDIVLKFDPIYAGEEAHFSNNKINSLNKKIDENGEVTIPNILLTESTPIEVYLFIIDEQEQYTKKKKILPVIARPKPEDYIYTEEENKIWDNKVDIFQGEENSRKILSTDENGKVVAEINVDEIITNKDIPLPTSADNGKYLGCENGAATWMPVEAPGGGATEETWELIDTIPLVKDTVMYEIASFEKYKKIAVTTRKRLVSGSASGTNWAEFRNENSFLFRATYEGSFFTYANAAVLIIAEGNLLKFVQFRSNNLQVAQSVYYTYFLYNGEYKGTRMVISISAGNAANLNDDASIEVYGVRR